MAALDGVTPAIIGAANAAGGSLQVDRSLRFNSADSAYLDRTPSSAGNRKTWTWSGWVKRNKLTDTQGIFEAYVSGAASFFIGFRTTTDDLAIAATAGVSASWSTDRQFRDPAAWYHIVAVVDTTSSTGTISNGSTDRIRLYVNGVQQTLSGGSVPSQDADLQVNNTIPHHLGRFQAGGYYSNLQLAEVHLVDGQALSPTDFGAYDDNNNWNPKEYSGTYGTNGFYLKFADNSSNAALGTDSSGNNNTWTVNNLTATDFTAVFLAGDTSDLSGTPFNGSLALANLFDVDKTNRVAATGNSTIVYTPTPAITADAFRIHYQKDSGLSGFGLKVNDVDYTSLLSNGSNKQIDISVTTLNKVEWRTDSGSQWVSLYYIEKLTSVSGPDQDSLIDTPTNYEAESGNNGGNYCTLSPLKNAQTLSDGNLNVVGGSSWQRSVGTLGMFSGKYYWEYEITASNEHVIGVGPPDMQLSGNLGAGDPPGSGYGTELGFVNGTGANGSWSNTGSSGAGDVIGIAFDADNGNMYVYKNGSALNGGIASHTGLVMPQVPVVSLNGSSRSGVINFGQRPFTYTPPTGYVSLCTTNLAEPVIADGSTAFNATLYTGNGSARNISTPYGPDFVWIKSRSATYDHGVFDVLRGATKRLNANSNGAEGTEANSVTAFNSDSFSLGSLAFYNNPSTTFVAWNWNAGTSTVSNTDGSITSQVRANTTAGFSIVSFTGDGSGTDTIGHGLNATPSTIWLKDLDNSNNWLIYTTAIDGSYDYVIFNSQNAKADSSYTLPTSSVFSYGTDAADYIAYCFAPVAGYSDFGTYAGNQSTDGPFIYTGFRPRFLMVKVYDQSDNWVMWDSSRGATNVNALPLYTNLNNSETTNISRQVDLLSNGFKLRSIDNSVNGTHNYLYWAFAEHPINTARAR